MTTVPLPLNGQNKAPTPTGLGVQLPLEIAKVNAGSACGGGLKHAHVYITK